MLCEELYQLVGDTDGAPSGTGLGLLGLAADVDLLRAVTGLAAAGVAAAVLIAGPQPASVNDEDPQLEVDVRPLEHEDLALAKAQRQGDDPASRVPLAVGHLQEVLHLLDRVRHHLFLHKPGRLGNRGRVLGEVAAAPGLVEGGAHGAVCLVRGSGRTAAALHLFRCWKVRLVAELPGQQIRTASMCSTEAGSSTLPQRARTSTGLAGGPDTASTGGVRS